MADTIPSIDDLVAENATLRAELEARIADLERSRQLLRHVIDSSPSAICVTDLDGRYLLINNRAAALMNRAPKELIGQFDHEYLPVESIAHLRTVQQEILRSGQPFEHEETILLPGGAHTFLASYTPIFNDSGSIYAIGGISTDITERVRAEEELRQAQERLQLVVDNLPVAVFLKAAEEGRYVLWNGACEHLFGHSADQVVGKTDYDLFPREQADGFRAKDIEVLRSGTVQIIPEQCVDSATLGRRTVHTTKVPIINSQGVPTHLLVICTDISDLKAGDDERTALQAQVIEAQQHALRELSTPLLPLSNNVVLMPIVGAMDSRRAQQVIETLLQGVSENNAQLAIVDITGVQVVDTQVANAFIQSARAVQLLGARVMLTGIRPEVAQTLVQLGVDLQGLMTRGSLQAGIAEAFGR